METGYYWVKYDGKIFPARWDGELWHSEYGSFTSLETTAKIVHPDTGEGCQTGCVCTTNPDGTITIKCS